MSDKDLRIVKTYKVLREALLKLMKCNSFKRITVNDLCKKAQVSRATFYTHFLDKYDFLKYFIKNLVFNSEYDFVNLEKINQFLYDNKTVVKNLFNDAESETLKIVFEFIEATLNLDAKKHRLEIDAKQVILSNIVAGGIISYINWQIQNGFPFDVEIANTHLCDVVEVLQEWKETVKQ